jgi:WD40 repeat protein
MVCLLAEGRNDIPLAGKLLAEGTRMKNSTTSRRLLVVVVGCALALAAEPAERHAIPGDRAILHFDVPAKAAVFVDGADQGDRRRLEVADLKPGELVERKVRFKLPGGAEQERTVFLAGGWEVRLAPLPTGARPELVLQTGHGDRITALAFSPDGKYLLTGSADKTAILWDAATGRQLRKFQGHSSMVSAVAFDADGKRVLTGAKDRTFAMWDVRTGARLPGVRDLPGGVADLAFHPGGGLVACLCTQEKFYAHRSGDLAFLWNLEAKKVKWAHKGAFHGIAFSTDGRELLTGGARVTAWDVETGKPRRSFAAGDGPTVTAPVFSPDRRRVLVRPKLNGDRAALLDAASGEKIQTFQMGGGAYPCGISPDGSQVLVASSSGINGELSLFDVKTGRELRTWRTPFGGGEHIGAISPDGRRVAGMGGEPFSTSIVAVLWDAASGKEVTRFVGRTAPVTSLAAGPGGRLLAGGRDCTATLWDAAVGRQARTFKYDFDHLFSVNTVALSADGKQALIASYEKREGEPTSRPSLALWDTQTGEKVREFSGFDFEVKSAAFSPDGKKVLGASMDKVALFDVEKGQRERTIRSYSAEFKGAIFDAAAFVPGGKQILTVSGAGVGGAGGEELFRTTVALWDLDTGKPVRTFEARTDHPEFHQGRGNPPPLAVSPDGKCFVAPSENKMALVRDLAGGRRLQALAHGGALAAAAFSRDGRLLLTGATDRLARVWDAQSGRLLRIFQGHADSVTAVAFGPDGRQVFTGSADGTVRLWDLASGDELGAFVNLASGKDWLVVTPAGLFDGSAGGRQQVAYRVGGGLNLVPVDRFFQDFYRPGLLAVAESGERQRPEVELGRSAPPVVKIVSPAGNATVEESQVTLEAEVRDEGGGVQGPWVVHNGVRVKADGESERQDKVYRRRFHIALVQGDNRLEVHAACGDGSQESEPALLVLRYEKALPRPHLYLVAVGVSQYAQATYKLKYARADAEAICGLFRKRAGTLYGANVHVKELFDAAATRANIEAALDDAARKARPQDTLLLFVAGHGTMVGQRYYFIPHEFKTQAGGSLDDDVRRQGLPADVLGDFLQRGAALKRMLILDTCASGGTVELFKVVSRNPFAFRGEIERLSHNQGLFVLAAAAATEEAKEPDKLGHGVLSYSLLAGLSAVKGGPLEARPIQPAASSRVVDVLEWFNYANAYVPRLTREFCGAEQNVHMSGKGNSFPVLPATDP